MLVFPPKNNVIPSSPSELASCEFGCAFFSGTGLDDRPQKVWIERQESEWLGALWTTNVLDFAATWKVLPSGGWGQLHEVWGGRLARGAQQSPLASSERSRLLFATLQARSAQLERYVCFSRDEWFRLRPWLIDPDFGKRWFFGPLTGQAEQALLLAQESIDARGALQRPSLLGGVPAGSGAQSALAPISLFEQVAHRAARRAVQKPFGTKS